MPTPNCECGELHAGHYKTGARNWNPDCPEHGLKSVWYNSPEQQQRRLEQNTRLRELQLKAKEARNRDRI
jgi:hypothetical protein